MPDPGTVAELTLLIEAQAKAREDLTAVASAVATAAARGFTDWYNHQAIAAWAAELLAQIRSVQRNVAALTDAYITRAGTLLHGRPVTPAGPIDVTALRGDVNMLTVYGRAADQYRYAISVGKTPAQALDAAVLRATTIASDDVDLAARDQATASIPKPGVTGYRRVIHPELPTEASLRSGTGPPPVCGLCIAASTVLNGPKEPMPIHANCRCLPVAVYGDDDFGGAINDTALKTLYAHAGGTAAKKLKRTRYVVVDHGELGAVLRLRGNRFTGPSDIPTR